jgi:hypothetical protein
MTMKEAIGLQQQNARSPDRDHVLARTKGSAHSP